MGYMKKDTRKLNSLSIILPAYNEEGNIVQAVNECTKVAGRIAKSYEVIVVNDGSTDCTAKIVDKLCRENPNIKPIHQENKGYGGALKAGFAAAKKDWIFFTDSDLQFDVSELSKFVSYTDEYDFIFGYRARRADRFHRKMIAFMLKIWNKIWLGFPLFIKDIDCAFKLMKRKSFLSIGEIYSSGAMITTEFILKIINKAYAIKQLPVTHKPRLFGNSTGSNVRVIWNAIKETFVLRKMIQDSSRTKTYPKYSRGINLLSEK
jgi:glycosyltransferase involved in cell wall biosynthesis